MSKSRIVKTATVIMVLMITVMFSQEGRSHCDTLDGPVILAAKKALEEKNANYVLIWVQKGDEKDIIAAFDKAVAGRTKAGNGEKADRDFFETLVRIHRAGEGAPYAGLKSAGTELNPGVVEADKSIESGKLEGVTALLAKTTKARLDAYFSRVMTKKAFPVNDVAAGREYVKAYVEYVHFVEGLYNLTTKEGGHHAEGAHDAHGLHAGGHDAVLHSILLLVAGIVIGMVIMYIIRRRKSA